MVLHDRPLTTGAAARSVMRNMFPTVVLRNSRDLENPSLPKLLDRWISTRKRPPEASYHPPVVSRAAPSCASMFLVGLKSIAMTRGDKNGEKG